MKSFIGYLIALEEKTTDPLSSVDAPRRSTPKTIEDMGSDLKNFGMSMGKAIGNSSGIIPGLKKLSNMTKPKSTDSTSVPTDGDGNSIPPTTQSSDQYQNINVSVRNSPLPDQHGMPISDLRKKYYETRLGTVRLASANLNQTQEIGEP